MAFADRFLVRISDPANLNTFLGGIGLGTFLTENFQSRFNSEFWQIVQVAIGATRRSSFEQPLWTETRILGREDHHGSSFAKANIDYTVYGRETALWTDAVIELDTTWQVNQFPGSV